ncbi:MAG TPA: DUF86 domain-containing protein, partial [Tepidisphaeraceae bacterium]|nr:DUF86 domain-containing protein [Tepidisphaeraceae bacterium]
MKGDILYLGHMIDMARLAQSFVRGRVYDELKGDKAFERALVHALQIIWAAARRVSDEFRQQHSYIPWRQIVAFRHRVVHDYLNVEHQIVWDIANKELQPLVDALAAILPAQP